MCGIVAVSSEGRTRYVNETILQSIKHRGPDDQGMFMSDSGDCELGHTRLSIRDLSDFGHQPMSDQSERYTLVYNGEIYNHESLRCELERKHGSIFWRSSSDTEVILEGFVREGTDFLGKLNGIFAIAIYDGQLRRLYVLRDPLGVKPLYCLQQNGAQIFASEVKAIRQMDGVLTTLRKQSLADVLSLMYVPEPYTMFNEIRKLAPGVCYQFESGDLIGEAFLFPDLSGDPIHENESHVIELFKQTFSDAVKRQLIADVPVSLFLSGGLDSSAVAVETIRAGGNVKDAYTIHTPPNNMQLDQQSDDLSYAKLIAKQFGLDLKVVETTPNMLDLLPSLSHFMEDGIADPAAINTYLICSAARDQGVKVMLSGQGADEYLGGYRRYLAEHLYRQIPKSVRGLMSLFGHLIPHSVPGSLNASARRIKKFMEMGSLDDKDRLVQAYIWADEAKVIDLFLDSEGIGVGLDHKREFALNKDSDIIDSMMLADQKFDLRSLNLAYTDKMSMAVGVEARVPFLDFELVKLMNSMPTKLKMKGYTQKYVLKKAMEGRLPRDVIYRSKAGFSLPIRSWLSSSSPLLEHYFSERRIMQQGIFKFESLKRLLDEQFLGLKDNAYIIFSMLSLQIWLDDNS